MELAKTVADMLTTPERPIDAVAIRFMTMQGDSMQPEIKPGDKIAVNLADCTPSPPGLFVLWDGLENIVCRLEFIHSDGKPMVNVSFANPAYSSRLVPLAECEITGRIVGRWVRTA